MNPTWLNFLLAAGAHMDDEKVGHFGAPGQEIEAARGGGIVADLSHLGVIQFSGEDSESFLQGQLSCDVRQATLDRAQLGSYCTPKGRMLATFLLWRTEEGFYMQLPAALREGIQKRLGMYVLRSKVKVSDASDARIRIGLAGNGAAAALAELGIAAPSEDYAVARTGEMSVIHLTDKRYEIFVSPDAAPGVWRTLSKHCAPAGQGPWEWLEIKAGVPLITAKTQEQFVPQMTNLELIGGVSFKKGCYPGQEIVARSQYLGKVKRRMHRVRIHSDGAPSAGDELFGLGTTGQSAGMIVNAQPSPEGGYDALAVILSTALEAGDVRWNSPEGPVLELLELPYSVG